MVHFWYFIKEIFLKYIRKISEFELSTYYPSFADLFISIEESGEQEEGIDAGIHEIDDQISEPELVWQSIVCGHILRAFLLVTQSILRKEIILLLLVIAKNIGFILLLQRPELLEDFKECEKQAHFICTYNGVPFFEK